MRHQQATYTGTTVYLDCAARSPIDPEVSEFISNILAMPLGNPHNLTHTLGRKAASLVDTASSQIADAFSAPVESVVLTSGATEANNLALSGFSQVGHPIRIATSAVEHASVLEPCRVIQNQGGQVSVLPVGIDGQLDIGALIEELESGIDLLSVQWVNNETGCIQNIETIHDVASEYNVPIHVDAAQALGRIDTSHAWNFAEMISLSSAKIGGLPGAGALICNPALISPSMWGGSQQNGIRPGTLPVELISSFGFACRIRKCKHAVEHSRLRELHAAACRRLDLSGNVVSPPNSAPGIINVCFPGIEAETLIAMLEDVAISSGSACTGSEIKTSHVLRAMGISERDALGAIRISFNAQTTDSELEVGISRILAAVDELRSLDATPSSLSLQEV